MIEELIIKLKKFMKENPEYYYEKIYNENSFELLIKHNTIQRILYITIFKKDNSIEIDLIDSNNDKYLFNQFYSIEISNYSIPSFINYLETDIIYLFNSEEKFIF